MMSKIDLEHLFEKLGTPDEGRRLIRKARQESPVRKVQSNGGNVVTRYCSRKMDRTIATESRTVEFPAAVLYEQNPEVLEYFPQPVKVDIVVKGGRGKAGRFPHTPDFLVIQNEGFLIEEWREEARLLRKAVAHPNRYVRGEAEWRCPPAEEYFADIGITYRLRSADELPRTLVHNLEFLADYMRPDCPQPGEPFYKCIHDIFRDRSSIHLVELLQVEGITADDVYRSIADGSLAFDLINHRVSETDRVLAFRDEIVMMFHRKVNSNPIGETVDRKDASILTGGVVRYDGHDYEIGPVGPKDVALKSGERVIEWPLSWLIEQHRIGKLTIMEPTSRNGSPEMSADKLQCLPPKALTCAIERMEWITEARTNPTFVPISDRTLQRYRKAMSEANPSTIDQHLALAPKYSNCGNRQRRIPDAIIDLISEIIRTRYNTSTNANVRWCYMDFVSDCQKAGIIHCSNKTFSKEVRKQKKILLREGKRCAYQAAATTSYLDLLESAHGVRPFQYVHIDHTELQIELRGPGSKKSLGRPWLSLALDAESRAALGFYLSFDPPSYRSCMMVLRDIVRRHSRMPDMLVLDNGKEFHSGAMQRVCALYGCDLRYRPSARPRFGSVMERAFGTAQSQLINNMKGNTQVLRHARMATKALLPENFVEWTLPGLHAAIEFYFNDLYGKEPHPAHGDGPVEHLRQRLIETGERLHRLVRFDDTFKIETCPSPVGRGTREVCNRRGIKIHHIWYWNDVLRQPRLSGSLVQVRIDPWDVRFVFVMVDGTWHRCRSKLAWLTHGYTETELRCAFEEMAKKHAIKQKDLSPERVAEWMQVRDATLFDERLRTRQAEARHIYDALDMTRISGSEPLSTGDGELAPPPGSSHPATGQARPRVQYQPRRIQTAKPAPSTQIASPKSNEDEHVFDYL